MELNRAVAVALAGDLAGGLARIDALTPASTRYLYFHAARADLLRRLGARERRRGYKRALALAGNAAERASCNGGWRRRAPDQDSRYSSNSGT